MKETLFENFLQYCTEDNEQLSKDIKTWLCDYFDFPNRDLTRIPITEEERQWINSNLTKTNQQKILGRTITKQLGT